VQGRLRRLLCAIAVTPVERLPKGVQGGQGERACLAMSADLRRLAEPVAARLRSGAAITSITQVVQELIENSLDAGARAVSISVHIAQGYVEVADDGAGMSLNDLARCGTRHCTSKIQSVDDLRRATTLGFRGEALASIGDIAVLTVCTRSHNSAETHEKWIKGSVTLSVGPSATSRRAGTTVTVRELFCTVPVRQRALGSEQTVRRELAACRAVLTQLALTRGHCGVTFSLYDAASRRSVLRTERALSQLSCFEQLFGREQATKLMRIDDGGEDSNRQHHEIGILRGYLSRPGCGYHSKELQFISINGRPFGTTKLHSCINARLRQLCQGPSQLLMRRQATADVHEGGRGVAPAPHLPANSIGRTYPLFVLELVLQPRYYDVTLAKMAHLPHEAQVCKLVEAALDQFVQEHQRLAKPSLPLPPFSKETEVGVDPPQFSWRLTSPPATRRHHTVASPDVPNPEPVTMTPPPQAPPSSAANLPSSIESRAVTIETEIATATTTITAAMLSPLATLDILPVRAHLVFQ
jgi:DNA mismatch repair protein MutL